MSPSPYPRPPSPPRRARWIRPAGSPGTYKPRKSHTGLKVATSLLGAFLGLAAGAIVFFTVEERAGIAVFCGIAAVAFLLTAFSPASLLWGLVAVEVALLSWTGWQIYGEVRTVLTAFSTTEGPVAAADAGTLSTAEGQLDAAAAESSFRLDLTEDEVTAVLQDALGQTEQPLRSIAVDIVDGPTPTEGTLDFTAEFKAGGDAANGILGVSLAGGIRPDRGALHGPGFVALARLRPERHGRLRGPVAGVGGADQHPSRRSRGGRPGHHHRRRPPGGHRGAARAARRSPPPRCSPTWPPPRPPRALREPADEVLGPGTVNGTFAEGAVYYLALGDSLAANVGVASAQDGYVSRVHRWLEERDGRRYGLLNLGVPGETSGSLLAGGQLDEARDFLAANRVAYITVDVGANDLLGHLTSPECSADLDAAACRARLDGALAAYEENLPEHTSPPSARRPRRPPSSSSPPTTRSAWAPASPSRKTPAAPSTSSTTWPRPPPPPPGSWSPTGSPLCRAWRPTPP